MASDDLGVSQSTVSRRISELERSIGMTLFARHPTGYFLTDEGRTVLKHAELIEDSIMNLQRGAAGLDQKPQGTVRLATSENLATDLIVPSLPAFRKRYPAILLEIISGTMTAEVGRREADMALRVVRPTHGNLKIRRVGHMTYSVYGSKAYVTKFRVRQGRLPPGVEFVTWDEAHAHLPAAKWLAREYRDHPVALVASSLPIHIAAVRAGLGLAVIPDFLATHEDLVAVVPADQLFSNDVWLVTHADVVASARIRAVADFLADVVLGNSVLSQ